MCVCILHQTMIKSIPKKYSNLGWTCYFKKQHEGPLDNIEHLSQKCLSERINSLQCYQLTRRCSHLLLYIDFTIDLRCAPLVSALWMCNEAQQVTDF